MSTMNISVTDDQAQLVDKLTREYDFANRSELFRAILRYLGKHPEVMKEIAGYKTTSSKK